MLQKPKAG